MCVEEEAVDLTGMTHGRCEHPHRRASVAMYLSLGDPRELLLSEQKDTSLFHRREMNILLFLFIDNIFVLSKIKTV